MRRWTLVAATLAPLALSLATTAGCSSSGPDATGPQSARPRGAVLLAERFNTPDGRAAYMGAFPELPTTPIDVSQLVELGPEGDVFACGGRPFFYNPDAGTITRYEVADDLRLTKGLAIDVLQEGIAGWTGAHVCASPTQAFIFNESGGRVVEWNPETMVIVDAFDVPLPEVSADVAIQFFEPRVAGNLVYFSVTAINYDTLVVEPRAILAVFDIATKTLSFDYDSRCQSSLGGYLDSAGNYYQVPEDGGFFAKYSPTKSLPPDCVLRVLAGSKTFDDSYVQYLGEGQSLRSMWPVDDEHALATVIPVASAPAPEDMWDWYNLPVTPTLFNVKTGAMSPYPGLPNVQPMNGRKLVLDGKGYYQVYAYDAEGLVTQVDLVELTAQGPRPALTMKGGDLLTLERLW
jgi:hypothetical protein